MKSEKGISLTSLVVYVIGISIIFGILANLTIYFNKNSKSIGDTANNSWQLTRLNEYLVSDTKKEGINSINVAEDKIEIISNLENIKYTYVEDGIYRNKVKICNNVQDATFEKQIIYDKTKLIIKVIIGETEQLEKTLEYVI